jgi:TPR repeat protein
MYLLGRGVRQDYSEAASWCKKSANQGDPDAQTILAGFYGIGKGVPQDYVLALMGNSGFVVGRFPPSRAVCDNFGDARP